MSELQVRLVAEPAERAAAYAVRHEVFTVGQGVDPAIERDAKDELADHVIALAGGAAQQRVVGTARLVDEWRAPDGGVGVVGRVAVAEEIRGANVGRRLMAAIEGLAARRGLATVELHAQVPVIGFYERLGYTCVGDEYVEAGIRHRTMRKPLLPGLRPVLDSDAGAVQALIGGCWAEYPGCVLDVDAEEPWMRAPATAWAAKRGAFWLLEPAPGDVVACAGAFPVGKSDGDAGGVATAELKSLYVAARARRCGFGRRLVWLVERWARELGASRLELWSDSRFTDAHRLYRELGYAQRPETRDLHDLSGTTELHFVRALTGEPKATARDPAGGRRVPA